jgi:ferric-dicitrate binding protein FerR (iron transport regulator)
MAVSAAEEAGEDRRAATAPSPDCFTMDRETLENLVATVNHYNSRQLVIVDPTIRRFRISGRICPTRLDVLIRGLHHLGIAAESAESEDGQGVIRLSGVRAGRRARAAK